MNEVLLGKIRRAEFGYGGYDDAMFGASFDFDLNGIGIGDFWGFWPMTMARSEHTKWSDAQREHHFLDMQCRIEKTLADAKVKHFDQLVGIPVEVTIEGNRLQSWRVLTEVL